MSDYDYWLRKGLNETTKERKIKCFENAIRKYSTHEIFAFDELGHWIINYLKLQKLDSFNTYKFFGSVHDRLGNTRLALQYYKKALEIDQNDEFILHRMAENYRNLLNYQKVIFYFQKSIKIDPNVKFKWINLGEANFKLLNYHKAIECFQKALSIEEIYCEQIDLINAWEGLGNSHKKLKEFDKALKCYQKVIKLDYNYDLAWENMGIIYEELKDYNKAIECYKNALKINKYNNKVKERLEICESNIKNKTGN
ncbi:MAG: tetratricopeptide repeat protein [Candidatus Helarchaeota archaeon]